MIEPLSLSVGFLDIVVIAHAAVTCAMTGVILIVQFVHYPLFAAVGEEQFAEYEIAHARRITWVVAPLMLVELVAAIALVLLAPQPITPALMWLGLVLLVIIWVSTAAVQVPLHNALASGFDVHTHRRLLSSNWVRVVSWLLRSLIAGIILLQYIAG